MTTYTPPSSGSCTVLGVPYADLCNPGRHVGVLLDASAQHPGRTGREVLSLGAMTIGLPQHRSARSRERAAQRPAALPHAPPFTAVAPLAAVGVAAGPYH